MLLTIHRTILLACFATWFGGFGFYVSIVVPIGTEVLGSAIAQGQITEQVTKWLNVFAAIAVAVMYLESGVTWNKLPGQSKWWLLAMTSCVAASLVGLVILHGQLDSMFDATELQVTDENQFYQLHRVYLWLSTFQWAAAWIWLVVLCYRWTREKMPTRAET